jgi:LPS O-antigen subunit length determinant protein (WzzB/FepE family)
MIKYEVLKDSDIEYKIPNTILDYTPKDLEEYSQNQRSATYYDLVKQFDTLEEARAFFENEKQYCCTSKEKGNGNIVFFLFDELVLAETEYEDDEDDVIIQSDWLDSYIADDDCLHHYSYVVDETVDFLIDLVGEATKEKAVEIEKHIDVYANDYIREHYSDIPVDKQDNIIDEAVREYKSIG